MKVYYPKNYKEISQLRGLGAMRRVSPASSCGRSALCRVQWALRCVFLVGAVCAYAMGVMAKPAVKAVMKIEQPDGSELSIVKRGDERGHKVYTMEGIRMVKNSEGVYEAALDSKEEDALTGGRRGIKTRGPGLYSYAFPTKGEQKGLVILVEFSDVKFNSKNKAPYDSIPAHTYFTDMLNKEGFDTYGGTGSARDWFIDNSNGLFKPEFDVFGPVTLPNTMKYYGENDRRTDEDKRPAQMVVDACKALDEQIDFKDYDRNGDGYVDNVYVFYAGYGEADTMESDAIWPHSWTISDATGSPLSLDGVFIDSYGCSNETCGYNEYGIMMSRPDGIGTFVHEFSHVMGLPDLYATDYYASYMDEPFTPGAFSVMDYGPYNNEGRTPPNYSAYERYALDWLVPEEMSLGIKTLEEIGSSNKALIARTETDREYFLFENRQLVGWDKYLPYHGMLVWHVDYYVPVFYNNTVNNSKSHQYVDLVEADNIQDYPIGYNKYPASTQKGDPFPGSGSVKEFGPTTTPAFVSWSEKPLGMSLKEIAENGGVISFEVQADNGSGVEAIEVGAEDWEVFALDGKSLGAYKIGLLAPGIYILRSKSGKNRKIAVH